jgi:hypothetical protein
MTIVDIPSANPARTPIDRRTDCASSPTALVRAWRRQLATYVRNAARDRQPVVTLSERVLSEIHHVHSVHR